ncbi:MAG: hypothetical protein LBH40_02155 [Alphaproteobacteria bacterium]|jgi:hypothetical protein|nr:hypothetical protein [Alphaproteobacteria bacterium]
MLKISNITIVACGSNPKVESNKSIADYKINLAKSIIRIDNIKESIGNNKGLNKNAENHI